MSWPATPASIPDAWRRSGGEALKVALKQGAKSKAPAYVWKNAEGTHRLSFQDAHARADALAATIRATAVAAKKVASVADYKAVNVGLVLKRSASLPLAQLATFTAGATFAPLDPAWANNRTADILVEIGAAAVISDADESTVATLAPAIFQSGAAAAVIRVDDQGRILDVKLSDAVDRSAFEAARAAAGRELQAGKPTWKAPEAMYLMYASNAAGKPTGCVVPTTGVWHRLQWGSKCSQKLSPSDVFILKTPATFDCSIPEMWSSLCLGATTAIVPDGKHFDFGVVADVIASFGVTVAHFVPSMLAVFLDSVSPGELPSLRHLSCSGEALVPSLRAKLSKKLGRELPLWNLYGPTEASIEVAHYEAKADFEGARFPIGFPMTHGDSEGVLVYVTDPHDPAKLVADGEKGEVCIGGCQVAYGYVNNPGLTGEKFLPNPHNGGQGLLYRTGDLGCKCKKTGALEYHGRADGTVKVGESAAANATASAPAPAQPAGAAADEEQDLNNPKSHYADDEDDWAGFSVAKWRSAMFHAKSFFSQLFDDTQDFIADVCEQRGGAKDVLLIEVGCGTGEALAPLIPHAKYTLGIDVNPLFIDFCDENTAPEHKHKVKYLVGDACALPEILADPKQVNPEWVKDTIKVVICVGNTIGIIPPDIRKVVYQKMKEVGGHDGAMVIVYWNGNKFGEATQNFYGKNPQLCGPFSGEHINLETCTLKTPSGYTTHWTKPEEAKGIFEDSIGCEIIDLVEKGVGVLVSGRELGATKPVPRSKQIRRVATYGQISQVPSDPEERRQMLLELLEENETLKAECATLKAGARGDGAADYNAEQAARKIAQGQGSSEDNKWLSRNQEQGISEALIRAVLLQAGGGHVNDHRRLQNELMQLPNIAGVGRAGAISVQLPDILQQAQQMKHEWVVATGAPRGYRSKLEVGEPACPTFVFFPAAGSSPKQFAIVYSELAKRCPLVRCLFVNPPGRDARAAQPSEAELQPWLDSVYTSLQPHLAGAEGRPGPCIFVGDSWGAIAAFNVAHMLREKDGFVPMHMLVSGSASPRNASAHLGLAAHSQKPIAQLKDDELLKFLKMGGIDEDALAKLKADVKLLQAFRADCALYEQYKRSESLPPLQCRATVLRGVNDGVTSQAEMLDWLTEFDTEEVRVLRVPGAGHYAYEEQPVTVAQYLAKIVAHVSAQAIAMAAPVAVAASPLVQQLADRTHILGPPCEFVRGVDAIELKKFREGNLLYRTGSHRGSHGELSDLTEDSDPCGGPPPSTTPPTGPAATPPASPDKTGAGNAARRGIPQRG